MSFWKQFFCKHLWKDIEETFLREERERISAEDHIPIYNQVKYYAINQKCHKCDKTQVISKRKLSA